MLHGTIEVTLDPLASPLRRPRVARALTWTLGILLAFASVLICTVVAGLGSVATHVFVRALASFAAPRKFSRACGPKCEVPLDA